MGSGKMGMVKATWVQGGEGGGEREKGLYMLMIGRTIKEGGDALWRRHPSNSSSELCARTAFGMFLWERLCDNEPQGVP